MKKYLIRLADHLDKKGLHKEANYLDKLMKLSEQEFEVNFDEPYVVDGSTPMGVSENLFELSWELFTISWYLVIIKLHL